jgi:hypothetical protein
MNLPLDDFDRSEMRHVDKNMRRTEQTVSTYVNHSASQNDEFDFQMSLIDAPNSNSRSWLSKHGL